MMRSNKTIKFFFCVVTACLIFPFFLNVKHANATALNFAVRKFEAQGLNMCMYSRFKKEFSKEQAANNRFIYQLIINSPQILIGQQELDNYVWTDDEFVALPADSGLREVSEDGTISCTHLMWNLTKSENNLIRSGSFGGLLENLGYDRKETIGSAKCMTYNFKTENKGKAEPLGSIEYCESSVNDNGVITIYSSPTTKTDQWHTFLQPFNVDNVNKISFCISDKCTEVKREIGASSWKEVSEGLDKAIRDLFNDNGDSNGYIKNGAAMFLETNIGYIDSEESSTESSSVSSSFDYERTDESFSLAYRNFFGEDFEQNDIEFSKSEQAALYQNYILSYWAASKQACADTATASESAAKELSLVIGGEYYHPTKLYDDNGASEYCYVRTESSDKKVYGINDDGLPPESIKEDDKIDFATVAEWLLENGPDSIDSSLIKDTAVNNVVQPEATCMNSGGAGSLGWIVCPVLDFMSSSAEGIYNNVLKPNLQVESGYFDQDATEKAWRIFQNIANTLFVVLVLAVIFSQLTGIGIDNYGIKKILPKLIVVAILINLSYLICVICVDLSNIIGNGLQNIFSAFNFDNTTIPTSNGNGGIDISGGAITALVILGGIVGVYAIYNNPALLITLLISALGVLVAVLFLFVLLAGRKAVIVILTILSPVVFMLYMLPNTKKLFDKWLKLWETMLLLYPVCGLLIGGGNFMSKLLLNVSAGDDAFKALTAMAIGILPIFFIPTMLKSAFAAIGTIGSSITGFGNRLRSGATGRLRNSERVKNAQARGQEHRIRTRAGLNKDGNLTKFGERRARFAKSGVGKFLHSDRRQAAYINAARKTIAEGESANAALTNALSRSEIAAISAASAASGSTKDPVVEYYEKLFEEAAKNGNINGMNSILSAATASGYIKDKDIAAMVRRNSSTIDTGFRGDPATRASWMRDIGTKYGNGFLGTDFELKQYMQSGGKGILGTNYGDYVKGNISLDDIKPEDILKLSGDSLAGLAKEGIINKSIAQQVLAKNPNLSADKRIMLGAIANGNANVGTITTAEDFKNDAKTLMNNHSARTTTIINTDESMVDAWTAPTPDAVNIVQNFNGGGSQMGPVDITWFARGASSQSGNSQNTPNPTTPEAAQIQAMIDAQHQNFQVNYRLYAQHVGPSKITGFYPAPNGYTAIDGQYGYFTDGKGHIYDAVNNEFSYTNPS